MQLAEWVGMGACSSRMEKRIDADSCETHVSFADLPRVGLAGVLDL